MTILDKIVAVKRTEVDRLPEDPVTVDSLRQGIAEHGPRRDFLAALANPRAGDVGLIAEVKKGSLKGEERQSALRSIMRADEPEAVDFIVKELRAGGGRNAADPRVRQVNMVNQIGRLSPPRFFEVVEEFADSTDEGLRLACAATFEIV